MSSGTPTPKDKGEHLVLFGATLGGVASYVMRGTDLCVREDDLEAYETANTAHPFYAKGAAFCH